MCAETEDLYLIIFVSDRHSVVMKDLLVRK